MLFFDPSVSLLVDFIESLSLAELYFLDKEGVLFLISCIFLLSLIGVRLAPPLPSMKEKSTSSPALLVIGSYLETHLLSIFYESKYFLIHWINSKLS